MMVITGLLRHLNRVPQYALSSKWTNASLQQFKSFQNVIVKRSFNIENFLKVTPKSAAKLRMKDKVTEDYVLIYKGSMDNYIRLAYPSALIFALVSTGALLMTYYYEGKLVISTGDIPNLHFINAGVEIWVFFGAMVAFTVAVFSIVFKYPFRVYRHKYKQEYIAIFLSAIPPKLRKFHYYKAYEANFINPLYYITKGCHFYLDKKRAFLILHCFSSPAELCEMLGST